MRRSALRLQLLLLLAIVATPSGARASILIPFALESVDTVGLTGTHVSMALDAEGNPRIAYYDDSTDDLVYAAKLGGGWIVEIVDGPGNVGQYTSIALDDEGEPRISYYAVSASDLKYAEKNDGNWTVQFVETSDAVGLYTSLALDESGNPAIAYYASTNGDLRYAFKSGGSWVLDIADSPGDVGLFASLVIDALGNPQIAYFDETNDNLRYATKTGGLWSTENVETAGDVGRYASIGVDRAGNALVSYHDASGGDLEYARKDGSGWTIETADFAGTVGLFTSLRVGLDGEPRIAYFDNTANDLKYAERGPGGWALSNIDSPGIVGWYASLALDHQGNPAIAYTDVTHTDLRFASTSIHLLSPTGGELWFVGSEQTIRWTGVGPIDLLLSADGGANWLPLASGLTGNALRVRIPHLPTRFGRIRAERSEPLATAFSDSFFAIDATLVLFDPTALKTGDGAVQVSWRSEPSPPVIAGYGLERALGTDANWSALHEGLLTEGEYTDRSVELVSLARRPRYRISAEDGWGDRYVLGETELAGTFLDPGASVRLIPNPAGPEGTRTLFRVRSLDGSGGAPVELIVRDLAGRTVRRLDAGRLPDGEHEIAWDARNQRGEPAASGLYILEVRTPGLEPRRAKLVLTR